MQTETDVLVIGAGPVGLALAIELGMRGVRVMVVERNARGGQAPRAKTTNIRSRAHLRRWGLADKLAEASPLGITYPNDVIFTTRLSGHKLAHIQNAFNALPTPASEYPEHGQWVPQYTLEKIMLERARTFAGVDVRFGVTFETATQSESGVVSTVQTADGETLEISSRFLIGADGSRSAVRKLIGAKMEGHHGISHAYNIIFRAPGLADAHTMGRAVMYWQMNSDGMSIIGPMDRDDKWFFMPAGLKDGETLSNEAAAALIKKTTGIDLPYEVLSADQWTASELLADRYRDGRIFLAGDACHLHPPFGGYGMNMGIGDGVDLGWKIAALLQGWGGPALLDSYEAERRPVHRVVIEEAVANLPVPSQQPDRQKLEEDSPEGEMMRQRVGAGLQATKVREFHTIGTVLGLCYEDSPIIESDGTPVPQSGGAHYEPSAHPGCLAPHAWLADGRSIYDAFGEGFTLVVGEGADEAQIALAEKEARELRVPLRVLHPAGVPVVKLYEAQLTLVRPDQHVAWRGNRWNSPLRRAVGLREIVAA
jgi:2-polyprenyl-6-methoxyphenol hydroxylase-like FAD-dependent oxidoreductase